MTAARLLVVMCVAALGLGCSAPPPVSNPAPVDPADYQATFDAAAAVLRDAGFALDRRDARFGQLTTEPKGSPTVFEPWRGDNVNTTRAVASTFGNLQRTVRVTLTPDTPDARETPDAPAATRPAEPTRYDLAVEVLIERYQSPTRRLSGATQGSVFYNLNDNPAELARRGIAPGYWEPVGRDPQLEARLLRRIVGRLEPAR